MKIPPFIIWLLTCFQLVAAEIYFLFAKFGTFLTLRAAYIVCSKLRHLALFLSTDTHGKATGVDLSYYSRETGAVLVSLAPSPHRTTLTHKLFSRMLGRRPLVPNTTN
jgi:hypothetical protein